MIIRSTSLVGMACLLASAASAASAAPSDSAKCRAIADPAKRLACYDRTAEQDAAPAEGEQTRAAPVMPSAAPRPSPAPSQARAPEPTRDERKVLTSGRIAATRPLRHGYFRLELEDGAAYETTVVGAPPPVGADVHIRHTPFGTTFFDIKGWSPITVRPARQ